MNKTEFEILRFLCEERNSVTQRIIAEETKHSVGTVNSVVAKFLEKGLINDSYQITERGIEALKPYKVKNAIILAAGMSTRFIPVSYELPKGLISVKGDIMIERIIRQLEESGIQEIVVVVGYMMEKFFYLRDKYNVKLVVNNEFSTKNTHSSIYVSRDYLSNTYICCSDNYYPHNMFHQYEYRAFYCSIYLAGTSYVERGFSFDADGLIYDTAKPSQDQWIMYGHAYFDQAFTDKFLPILESYFGRPGIEYMYWETIYAENVKKLPMWIQKCTLEDILEFDSMEELKAFDKDYIFNNKVKVFENICRILCCELMDIQDVEPIKRGLNNQSFRFRCNEEFYVYRHPGANAFGIIDRGKEASSLRAAKKLKIDETLVYIDEVAGWKISKYINTSEKFDFSDKRHVAMLAEKLKILHGSKISVGFSFDYRTEADRIIEIEKHMDALTYRRILSERDSMEVIFDFLEKDKWQVSLCHNDLYEPNLLVKDESLYIIDWEFAGDADIGYDICKLFAVENPPYKKIDEYIEMYFGRKTNDREKLHLIACASVIYYYWYIWSIYANKNNEDVSAYMIGWFDKMKSFRETAIRLMDELE